MKNIVECTFDVLKNRFRCLHHTGGALLCRLEKAAKIIVVCCMLHSIAEHIGRGDDDEEEQDDDLPPVRQQNAVGVQTHNSLIQSHSTSNCFVSAFLYFHSVVFINAEKHD